ncbi:6-bladed beta-propeller [uncultured Rikenella sp.]|uniref:6-bladed beta-propeller n=1 Tax=uncultured Rikenella sp. TaxID=368003 RepID=UPI0025F94844|nr:6-bladed beta-propeller [uncultured Rikenella sp.]
MKKFIFAGILISAMACTSSPESLTALPTVVVNPALALDYDLDDVELDYKIVSLDDSVILGEIVEASIFSEYVFLHDKYQNKIHIYDTSGRYLNTLDRYGKGPQEYLEASLYAYDTARHLLLVNSCQSSLNAYRVPSLEFVYKQDDPNSYVVFKPIDADHYFTQSNYDEVGLSGKSTILNQVTGNHRDITDQWINTSGLMAYSTASPSSVSVAGDGDLLYCHPSHLNTLYRIDSARCTPVLNVDFGSWNMPEESWTETERMLTFVDDFFASDHALKPQYFIMNDSLLSFWYWHSGDKEKLPPASHAYVRNSRTGKELLIDRLRIKDAEGILTPIGIYQDYYVALVDPAEMFSPDLESDSPITREIVAKTQGHRKILLLLFRFKA